MPRTDGVYTPPAGTKGVPDTTIRSAPYNALVDDLTADANNARPITAGGTGATNATDARENIGALASDDVLSALLKDSPVDADGIVVTDSEDTGKLKRILWSKVKAVVNLSSVGAAVAAANGKETPDDSDTFVGIGAGGSALFKTTWGNIKARLKSYFDTFYVGLATAGQIITGNKVIAVTNGNIGSNNQMGLEIRPENGVNTDAIMSFHIPTDTRRVNIGLRPSAAVPSLGAAFGIGGGSLGATFYNFWHSGNFSTSNNANTILSGSQELNVYTAAALLNAMNSRANAYASTKVGPNLCAWNTGIAEIGSIDVGYNNVTIDCPQPYVVVGLRSASGTNRVYVRTSALRNYT